MRHRHWGIAVLAAFLLVAFTAGPAAAGCCYNPCCVCCCPAPKVVMKQFTVVKEFIELKPFTVCGPCGTVCTVLKPVKVKKEVKVMRPVQICGPVCGP